MRPMLEAARRHEEALRPLLEAAQTQQETFRRMSEGLQLNAPALELARQIQVPQMQLAETLGKTVALSGVVDEAKRLSDLTERPMLEAARRH